MFNIPGLEVRNLVNLEMIEVEKTAHLRNLNQLKTKIFLILIIELLHEDLLIINQVQEFVLLKQVGFMTQFKNRDAKYQDLDTIYLTIRNNVIINKFEFKSFLFNIYIYHILHSCYIFRIY